MAKGLNINAVPFEPGFGASNNSHFSEYLQGPPFPINPGAYVRPPAHPYDGPMYQYGNPEPHPIPTVPMFYYGPNYPVMPQAPCQWPVVPPPLAPPQPRQPAGRHSDDFIRRGGGNSNSSRGYHNHGSRGNRTTGRNNTVLKVLTSTSSAAAAASSLANEVSAASTSQQASQGQTLSVSSCGNTQSTTTASAAAPPQPLLGAVAKATPIQLGSAEDFPALGGGATEASKKTGKHFIKGASEQAAAAGKNIDSAAASVQSKPPASLPFSYSAAIKQPRPHPASHEPHPSPAPSTPKPAQSELSDRVNAVAKVESSETAEANKLQQKQKKSRPKRRSKTKKKKKQSAGKDKQQQQSSAVEEQPTTQQPAFQLEQEDFPTLQGLPLPSPPPVPLQMPAKIPTGAEPQQKKQQPLMPSSLATVARKQHLNRAARQSLLLSSSLSVVNKAIVVANQRPAAAAAGAAKPGPSGGVSAGAGHSSAPLRVGKQRERPKAKKKSLTKKIILMERQARRKAAAATGAASVDPVEDSAANNEADDKDDKDASSAACASTETTENSSGPPAETTVQQQQQQPPPPPPSQPSKTLHSRRFREYCDQLIVKSVQELSMKVLRDLVYYQARAQARDPAKAKQKRRLVMGLREARKHIGLNRIRLVFISPDLERVQAPGGLDDSVNQLIGLCQQRSVPYVFGLKRREMGRVLRKTVPVSVVAVFDYQGCEANVNALLELVRKAKADYETLSRMALECGQDEENVANDAAAVANATTDEQDSPSAAIDNQQQRPSANHSRNLSDTSNAISEPVSELDASAPSAGRTAGPAVTAAASSQLYGFHSRQSSLGVVVIAQAIDELAGSDGGGSGGSSEDKVAKWLSTDA